MQHTPEGIVCMVRGEDADYLLAPAAIGFAGDPFTANDRKWTLAPLTAENAAKLRSIFPFTAPRAVLHEKRTVGVGDRLGIAAPGHIRAFEKYDAYPVLAQQSIRELTLTGRTFEQVLDCASFAVFRCGYTRGFGADGDHLKTAEEVAYAIRCGYTIITLDCSEHICNDAALMTAQQVEEAYCPDPVLEKLYLGRTFLIEGQEIAFEEADFHRMSLIYNEAIDFAVKIYRQFLGGASAPEFEVSIDETVTPTTPAQHYYVAAELIRRGVRPATIAPRFCGEFQKGVDYIGDLNQFQKEFDTHARIARHFGYKISVHSGSDKFSVFRKVGKYTQGIFHLKTAGTSWLEAMAVVAQYAPSLYREIHDFALHTGFARAKEYYHVTTDLTKIPPLDSLQDDQLPALFEQNDSRQLIHITYGEILTAKQPDGTPLFRDRLYRVWRKYEEEYLTRLERHIEHHLQTLYEGFLGT